MWRPDRPRPCVQQLQRAENKQYVADDVKGRGTRAFSTAARPVGAWMSAAQLPMVGTRAMLFTIHMRDCRNGMWENAARMVQVTSLMFTLVLDTARLVDRASAAPDARV